MEIPNATSIENNDLPGPVTGSSFHLPDDFIKVYQGGPINAPVFAKEWLRGLWRHPEQLFSGDKVYSCACCRYSGRFVDAKRAGPKSFRCPNCASRPRDRQIQLIIDLLELKLHEKAVLHIAPEWPLFRRLKDSSSYVGGDIIRRKNANAVVDLTHLDYADGHFDVLICNHVLEHIPDDAKALQEAFRVLRDDSLAFVSVPIDRNNPTWWPPEGMSVEEVEKRCGWDHKRLYGNDFSAFLESFGFYVFTVEFDAPIQEQFRLFEEPIFLLAKGGEIKRLRSLEQKLVQWTVQLKN